MRWPILALLLLLPAVAHAQSCTPNENNLFTINGSTLSGSGLSAQSYTAGVVVNMSGVSNSGTCFPVTMTGQSGGGSCTSSVGGPSPTPCPVGQTAPSGYHWNLTFYDDFRTDSSINGSKWTQNNTAGSVVTCCDPTYGIRSYPHLDLGNLGNTWSELTMNYSLRQRFGYFEMGFTWPTDAAGEGDGRHVDLNVNVGPGGCGSACSELDISEQELGTGAQYIDNSFLHDCDASQSSRPQCGGVAGSVSYTGWSTPDGQKMSAHNRVLGMNWVNDSSAHGTVQVFLDGTAVTGTHTLVSSAFDLGVAWDIFDVACESNSWGNGSAACNPSTSSPSTNPLSVQYVAEWQLVPG